MPKYVVQRQKRRTQYFTEDLGNGIELDMIQVPGGQFQMGSPEDEPGRSSDERPQHLVTVSTFFMGRYPITQAQWKAVSSFPRSNRKLNPDPSYFKGDRHPVECVNWYHAVEFCDHLSQHTKRLYRLPTEAEWEYACCAGSMTPFHFGKTITAEVANYDARKVYGEGVQGECRGKTTPVDYFGTANDFGLSGMHGNVWEWCQDHWHDNYKGAPANGSAWLTDNENTNRVSRGGAWSLPPRDCRSAYRGSFAPDYRFTDIGFRVVCVVPRILQ